MFLALSAMCFSAHCADYYWVSNSGPTGQFPSADAACRAAYEQWTTWDVQANPTRIPLPYRAPYAYRETLFVCDLKDTTSLTGMPAGGQDLISRGGNSCPSNETYNSASGACESPDDLLPRKQLGLPKDILGGPNDCHGNPINGSTGNKFQEEYDYQDAGGELEFARIYNGADGQWRHSYSTSIYVGSSSIALTFEDGRSSLFMLTGTVATAEPTELGQLNKVGTQWVYTSPANEQFSFDAQGRLVRLQLANGKAQALTYTALSDGSTKVTVVDSQGRSISFREATDHRPLSLAAFGLAATYGYNGFNELSTVNYAWTNKSATRIYLYEDARNQGWLTGIIDERGVRYATWHYDDQGRAISSEHASAAEKVMLSYNSDGSTTITNALGHVTTNRYQVIQGIKHIASVEGQPATGCPASNSSYTYTAVGQVATKTDALGHVAAYTYDTQGREIQRVEAQGTPQVRTTVTTWHGATFLPETVVTAGRTTTYTYDVQNRLLSTSSRSN
jgi:YD repeat-containing protein